MLNNRLLMAIVVLGGLLPALSLCGQEKPDATPNTSPPAKKSKQADKKSKQADKTIDLFDGKTMKGWKTADKFTFEQHGKVRVHKGELQLGIGQPATGVVFAGKFPRNNYELSLQAKRTDGGDFFCGLTFPVDKEYCSLIVGGWGGGVVGLSNVDANSAVENETTGYLEFKKGQWYTIKLRVTDDRIEAWIDKEQVVDLQRMGHKFAIWWEQEPLRPLGVATWNTAGSLRNIKYRKVKPQ